MKADPAVAQARYLLFSTHALLSETLPSQSSLVLSLAGDGNEDGLLQAHEIDALELEADLVVLSGCETALGDNVRGEGLLGLARAFFHAGAHRLVASLWKVADCSAADLIVDLFRRLRSSRTRPRPCVARSFACWPGPVRAPVPLGAVRPPGMTGRRGVRIASRARPPRGAGRPGRRAFRPARSLGAPAGA